MIVQTSLYIIQNCHIFEESNILKCSCNSCFIDINNTFSCDILSVQLNDTLCRLINTCEKVEYCCFSGAVWSDQAVQLTFFDFHMKIIYSVKTAKLDGKITYL